jgi:proteic killer suppression protein
MGPDLIKQFRKKVGFLASAENEQDLVAYKALRFEKLLGKRAGQHSIRLNDQWRLIVRLETDAEGRMLVVVEVVDYH